MWWLLTREVLRLRGSISREVPWEIMVDLYFYRDPNEESKEEDLGGLEVVKPIKDAFQTDWATADVNIPQPEMADWGAETMQLPPAPAAIQTGYGASKDWSTTDTGDWAAASTGGNEWGGGTAENWG